MQKFKKHMEPSTISPKEEIYLEKLLAAKKLNYLPEQIFQMWVELGRKEGVNMEKILRLISDKERNEK